MKVVPTRRPVKSLNSDAVRTEYLLQPDLKGKTAQCCLATRHYMAVANLTTSHPLKATTKKDVRRLVNLLNMAVAKTVQLKQLVPKRRDVLKQKLREKQLKLRRRLKQKRKRKRSRKEQNARNLNTGAVLTTVPWRADQKVPAVSVIQLNSDAALMVLLPRTTQTRRIVRTATRPRSDVVQTGRLPRMATTTRAAVYYTSMAAAQITTNLLKDHTLKVATARTHGSVAAQMKSPSPVDPKMRDAAVNLASSAVVQTEIRQPKVSSSKAVTVTRTSSVVVRMASPSLRVLTVKAVTAVNPNMDVVVTRILQLLDLTWRAAIAHPASMVAALMDKLKLKERNSWDALIFLRVDKLHAAWRPIVARATITRCIGSMTWSTVAARASGMADVKATGIDSLPRKNVKMSACNRRPKTRASYHK